MVQLWWLVILEPVRVQRCYAPHFKGLIYGKVEPEAQGRDSTFTIRHAQLKKAILLLKRPKVPPRFWAMAPNYHWLDLSNEVHNVSELPVVPKIPAVKFEQSKETSVLILKRTFFQLFKFDGWYIWNHWEFRDVMYLIWKVWSVVKWT